MNLAQLFLFCATFHTLPRKNYATVEINPRDPKRARGNDLAREYSVPISYLWIVCEDVERQTKKTQPNRL